MSGLIAELFYDDKWGMWRWLRGKETFYNERNEMMEFDSSADAISWLKENHPDMTIKMKDGQQWTLDMKKKGDA